MSELYGLTLSKGAIANLRVIFRKVTNGFHSDWGAELFAQVRSLINTAKRQGISAFDDIFCALTFQKG
ncbi:MAG: hypothetical protein HY785_05380 [Oscillatoriophycideae cyanobacterium NC_groundwater_1537_Pr4_S-0.65um_50_18]|nr:hypothetical protein [Oscillatoriophycideae cyanobacterium NC_groundwater_1537_Pr4_S-0.65um_50_18]